MGEALGPWLRRGADKNKHRVAKQIIEVCKSDLPPSALTVKQIGLLNCWLEKQKSAHSRYAYATCLRAILKELAQRAGASRALAAQVIKPTVPKPRNVTATSQERAAVLAVAPLHLRCFILLCSDLAIRSGTAAKLGPEHYDRTTGTLTFRTKYEAAQRIHVTAELREILDTCPIFGEPFIAQLPRSTHWRSGKVMPPLGRLSVDAMYYHFDKAKKAAGITRSLTFHDFRRATARAVYGLTSDLRDVQSLLGHSDLSSTLWYLQDAHRHISVSTLELAKLSPTTERLQ